MHNPDMFPMVIQFCDDHGLELSAKPGIDYFEYKMVFEANQLPLNKKIKIIAVRVKA